MKPAVAGLALAAGLHFVPSVATIPALHRSLLPRLSGQQPGAHVALTFDDGPDPASTPAFLDALARLDVQATFFLLGSQLAANPALGRRLVHAGHEVAVHGWLHRPHLLRAPWRVYDDAARTYDAIERVCGVTPRFWRPPNGVISGAGLLAARRLGLVPVLWTADGRDWAADATPASIAERVGRHLRAGGVVLLHDSDVTSAPDAWRSALGALPHIVARCRAAGWAVGPLREHGLVTAG
jgi:peptidoglycan/xylan/chitin deacetylase (PgdA/CDA1 family)